MMLNIKRMIDLTQPIFNKCPGNPFSVGGALVRAVAMVI